MNKSELTHWLKSRGEELGFARVGVSRAGRLEQEAFDLEKWLSQGRHGQMAYMEKHFDERVDPTRLVPGARSVISVMQAYYPAQGVQQPPGAPRISRYAWGPDYHTVLKHRLYTLFEGLRQQAGEVAGRVFVDSAPVMDKAWARRGGLGWIGKHTNLISPQKGSWFFLGEIITDLELEEDGPVSDHCGTCTRCLDACPTGALTPYQIDAKKCISYLTIELKSDIPREYRDKMEGWAYGCDICQEVCPWNRFTPSQSGAFDPLPHIGLTPVQWQELTPTALNKLIRPTAMSRIRRDKWLGTLQFLKLLSDAEPLQQQHQRSHNEDEIPKYGPEPGGGDAVHHGHAHQHAHDGKAGEAQ